MMLPNNPEAERAVLGCIMLSDSALREVKPFLEASDFFSEANRVIYSSMLEIEGVIDPVTLHERLKASGNVDKAGGLVGISSLADGVATAENVEYYARIVSENATRRKIHTAGQQISNLATRNLDLSEIKESASSALKLSIVNENAAYSPLSLAEHVNAATESATSSEPVRGTVLTRMGRLDSEYGGFFSGIPYLLAARTSMGKSTTALNIIFEACMPGKRVILFSFEETRQVVIWRLLSKISQVPIARIFKRNLTDQERNELKNAAEVIRSFKLIIIDRAMSSQRICDICEQENERDNLGLVVIDLLGKVKEDPRIISLYQKVTQTSNNISLLPTLIDSPVLALHQIGRGVESRDNKMPTLSDLRDSGSIEQDFKTIMFLLRPYYYDKTKDPNEIAMCIAKNSNGPVGNLPLWCDLSRMTVRAQAEDRY